MKTYLRVAHPHAIPNLYNILFFAEHKKGYFEECL